MALFVCVALAIMYVGILYVPPIVFKVRPKTQRQLLLQRFACATLASVISTFACLRILPVGSLSKFSLFGIRSDHLIQATLVPLLLTALLYLGPLFVDLIEFLVDEQGFISRIDDLVASVFLLGQDVVAWRNYVMAPLSEEIVFRACMIPILLCGGYSPQAAMIISPALFSLAHVHRFWELVHHENYSPKRAGLIIVAQVGYTIVFGCYAAFLYVRTGHLIAAVVPHVFCNIMGFPDLVRAFQNRGLVAFMALALPLSSPDLYNDNVLDCKCWQGFCWFSSSS